MTNLKTFAAACLTTFAFANVALGEAHETSNADDVFLPENAILDTSILFAIGAREAQQELRGSYGWDTFQEGLVEGVYFRFDPDGYARFSPNARLDADLFEVLCRPRTLNCVARKGPLNLTINAQGMLQMSIEGVAAGDQFFISDLINEIELPDRILQPLDARFENVLAVGGDLIIRRGQNETHRISLIGFSAVTSYLRWILAEQDYLALPRNWPVPNGSTTEPTTLTAPDAWRNVAVGASTAQVQASDAALIEASTPVSEEIASLKALVEQISMNHATEPAADVVVSTAAKPEVGGSQHAVEYELGKAIARIEALERELERLSSMTQSNPMDSQLAAQMVANTEIEQSELQDSQEPHLIELASQIQNLTDEFGIDPSVAALLLRQKNEANGSTQSWTSEDLNLLISASSPSSPAIGTGTILEMDTALDQGSENETKGQPTEEFMLLTDYFRSVSRPEQ